MLVARRHWIIEVVVTWNRISRWRLIAFIGIRDRRRICLFIVHSVWNGRLVHIWIRVILVIFIFSWRLSFFDKLKRILHRPLIIIYLERAKSLTILLAVEYDLNEASVDVFELTGHSWGFRAAVLISPEGEPNYLIVLIVQCQVVRVISIYRTWEGLGSSDIGATSMN
jgi:hypothetical protein